MRSPWRKDWQSALSGQGLSLQPTLAANEARLRKAQVAAASHMVRLVRPPAHHWRQRRHLHGYSA
jgi:hypothetical protein